ncbi:MAG: helix-turn-helix domain-containing protein, partial [Sphingobacteriales bacterium]
MELSERIKELRSQHGFSQDEMAKRAGLSLRTIQRIESGETEPRGDTLRRIAEVFNLKPEDLKVPSLERDKYFLPVLNLSALSFLLFPLLGIIVPLVIWVLKREKSTEADGKRLLNFQITWCLALVIIYGLLISQKMFHFGRLGGPESMLISLIGLYT